MIEERCVSCKIASLRSCMQRSQCCCGLVDLEIFKKVPRYVTRYLRHIEVAVVCCSVVDKDSTNQVHVQDGLCGLECKNDLKRSDLPIPDELVVSNVTELFAARISEVKETSSLHREQPHTEQNNAIPRSLGTHRNFPSTIERLRLLRLVA